MAGHEGALALVLEDFLDLFEGLAGVGPLRLLLLLLGFLFVLVPGEHVPDHREAFLGLRLCGLMRLLFGICLEERMGLDLLKSQPVVVVDHEDLLNQVLQLGTDPLAFRKGVLASLDLFQRLLNRPALERAELVLQAVEDDADSPHIRGERIPEPTHCLRRNIIRSPAGFAFQLSGVGQLAGKAKIAQFDLILRIQVEVAKFEILSMMAYSRCRMFLEWM